MKSGDVVGRVVKLVKDVRAGQSESSEVTREMTADEFVAHAEAEIGKLDSDSPKVAMKRLRLLEKAVERAKALNWEDTETVKVPVMNDDTTAGKDKSEREGSLTLSPAAATLFSSNGMADWTAKIGARLEALKGDDQQHGKAEWTTKYVNDLPDSSFLYIEPGGQKDSGGRTTPRDKRHFPVREASGKVDAAHAQNAIARIPQSKAPGLDAAKKKALQEEARKLLDGTKKLHKGIWPDNLTGDSELDWGADD
jgi:hypothetical protein